ncbi:MAG: DUF460 domain-containing protein [Methanoculleaceae archaeon]
MKVFGIDLVTGSVRSRTRRPRYALCRMENGEVISEEVVNIFRLLRAVRQEEPDILAVDSLQEIAGSTRDIYPFLQELPPRTRLVQVTGGERPESLVRVAGRYNIRFDRYDPSAEARAIARLASLGAGAEVVAFENITEVVVSRRRSPGKGGWSQNRYIRRIHGAVQRTGRRIEAALRSAGLEFEKTERAAFGGASRVFFEVHAPREMVPVHSSRGSVVQVRVSGRRLDRIRFVSRGGKRPYIIVGLDPGTTTGIAALDLEGRPVHLTSGRQMAMSDIVEEIHRVGRPLVIASDVPQMPFSVEKIRRAFNAIGYVPGKPISVETKTSMTASYACTNDHERDALTAALDAYRHYRGTLEKIGRKVPPGMDIDEVRARVLRGRPLDVVLEELSRREKAAEESPGPELTGPSGQDERVIILDGMVKRLRQYVVELEEAVRERDSEIERLHERLRQERSATGRKIRRDLELARKEEIIRNLRRQLRRQKRINRSLRRRLEVRQAIAGWEGDATVCTVKVMPALTRNDLRQIQKDLGLSPDDLLYLSGASGWSREVVRELARQGVRAIITAPGVAVDPQLEAICLDLNLPLLPGDAVPVSVRGPAGTADRDLLYDALKAWEERYDRYIHEKSMEQVELILEEYRQEREREVKRGG